MTEITEENLFTAACLWEAALEALSKGEHEPSGFAHELLEYREAQGTFSLREKVALMAPQCDAKWASLTDDEQEEERDFDWEFVPNWLEKNFFKLEASNA